MRRLLIVGSLFMASTLLAQDPSPGQDPQIGQAELIWFTLRESPEQMVSALSKPAIVADFGKDFQSWQYQIGTIDHHEFSHQVVFRKSDRSLVSVTRNYESERTVDTWFPESETTVHRMPGEHKTQFTVRVRRLAGGRVLMAMGVSQPGQKTGQIVSCANRNYETSTPGCSTNCE